MVHHWPKELPLHSSLFGPDSAVNYDYIVTNNINSLLPQNVSPMAHTLTIVKPIWPVLQNLSKTLMYMYMHVHVAL